MRNTALWKPSKFVLRHGRLRASRDGRMVSSGSWLITDLVAECYGASIPMSCRGLVLDLGCGTVPLFEVLRGNADSIICIDWPGSIHAKRHVDCFADLNLGVPLQSDTCDTVVLADVLEHLFAPAELLREVARVLRAGGRLIMNVPFLYRIHEMPHDYFRFTEFALRRMLEGADLEVELLRPIGGAPEVVADTLAKLLAAVPLIGRGSALLIQCAVRGLRRIAAFRRASDRSAVAFPLGYFIVASKRPLAHR